MPMGLGNRLGIASPFVNSLDRQVITFTHPSNHFIIIYNFVVTLDHENT